MLGDTLEVLAGGPGGTSVTLNKINQDGYGAEYLNRSSNGEIRVKIRHSTENNANLMSEPFERHNVEFTRLYFEDGTTYLEDTYVVFSMTLRVPKGYDVANAADWIHGMVHWIGNAALTGVSSDTVIDKLIGWES